MAKNEWSAIAIGSFVLWCVMSIPIITTWIFTRNWILPVIISVISLATNIIIGIICINEFKGNNNNEEKSFITKEELERFKRESKECDKHAK